MTKFRKKSDIIEAIKFDGDNAHEIIRWAHDGLASEANAIITIAPGNGLRIRPGGTFSGYVFAYPGDWVVKDKGRYFSWGGTVFAQTYEAIE